MIKAHMSSEMHSILQSVIYLTCTGLDVLAHVWVILDTRKMPEDMDALLYLPHLEACLCSVDQCAIVSAAKCHLGGG